MNSSIKDRVWTSQALQLFGSYLIEEGEYGYGLLCIHGSFLGMKITEQLKLKWSHFIDKKTLKAKDFFDDWKLIGRENDNNIILYNEYLKLVSERVYFLQKGTGRKIDLNDFIYTKRVSGKVIETSNLNKELSKFYEQFKGRIFRLTGLELAFRSPKSNSFEIAWARDNVIALGCLKSAFKAIGKHMGHRSVNDTSKILDLNVVDGDEIVLRYDLNLPTTKEERFLLEPLANKSWLTSFIVKNWFIERTEENQKIMDFLFKENPSPKERE